MTTPPYRGRTRPRNVPTPPGPREQPANVPMAPPGSAMPSRPVKKRGVGPAAKQYMVRARRAADKARMR